MEIPEILPIFVTCSFILCLFRGRSFWMKVDFFYTVVLGSIYYFCPQWLLDKQIQGTSDLIHGYMLNLSGAAMLGVAVIQYLTRNTNDAWVTSSIMFSKIVAYGTVLANSVIGHLKPGEEHWNEHHFFISICIPAAALLCSIRYTMLCYVGAHSSNKRFNKIAVSQFLDLLVLVFLGFYQCCYPEESLFVFRNAFHQKLIHHKAFYKLATKEKHPSEQRD